MRPRNLHLSEPCRGAMFEPANDLLPGARQDRNTRMWIRGLGGCSQSCIQGSEPQPIRISRKVAQHERGCVGELRVVQAPSRVISSAPAEALI